MSNQIPKTKNSSHALNDDQWEKVKEWTLDGFKQIEIVSKIKVEFGLEITQAAICLSRHYKAAKAQLQTFRAEQATQELQSNLPEFAKQLAKQMKNTSDQLDRCNEYLTTVDITSAKYKEIAALKDKYDKSYMGYLDSYNALMDNAMGMNSSGTINEEANQEVTKFVEDLRNKKAIN